MDKVDKVIALQRELRDKKSYWFDYLVGLTESFQEVDYEEELNKAKIEVEKIELELLKKKNQTS